VGRTGALDLVLPVEGGVLMVDGLAGQREHPDLRYLAQRLLLVGAQREHLASLGGVLHHLGVTGVEGGGVMKRGLEVG